ncbi:MAG: hypothetical protein ACH36H_11215, partial [Candidatus Nanopelagicales bacterium]
GCVTDLLNGIFYASSQPIVPGHSFTLPIVDAQRTIYVTMKAESRESGTALGPADILDAVHRSHSVDTYGVNCQKTRTARRRRTCPGLRSTRSTRPIPR